MAAARVPRPWISEAGGIFGGRVGITKPLGREIDVVRDRVRYQLLVAFAAYITLGSQDGALGVLLPSLQRHYGLTPRTVSVLFLFSTAGYLLGAPASGLLIGRLGWRRYLMLGGGALVAGMGSIALVPPWLAVLLALVVVGAGVSVIDAGLNAYVTGLPDNTARLNYLHAGYGAGAMIGPLLASGVLAASGRWNWVYGLIAAGYALSFLGFAIVFGAQRVGEPARRPPLEVRNSNPLIASLRLPSVWLAASLLFVYVGVEFSTGSWTYSILTVGRGQSPLVSGWLVSGYWTGLMLGRIGFGRVPRRYGRARLIRACLAGVFVGLLTLWLAPGLVFAGIGLVVMGVSLGPIYPTTIASVPSLVPERLLPSAVGILSSLGAMGAAIFPWLAGMVAGSASLGSVLPFVLAWTIVMAGLGVAVHRIGS